MTQPPETSRADRIEALSREPMGVYAVSDDSQLTLVHAYQEGEYMLQDVFDLAGVGIIKQIPGGITKITLTQKELRQLKAWSDAYSFDYDEEFIEMCLALHRYAHSAPADEIVYLANFV